MIKWVKIEGYKSFQSLRLELRPLTVIFGPNASGKSNFLDALYFISRAVTRRTLKDAFEGHRGFPLESFYYGDEGYEGLLKKPNLQFTFEVAVELSHSVIKKIEEIVEAKRRGIDSRISKKIITEPLLR
ncbi:MAG: AAA family ATPase, partial [Candidatus Tectomicrobia bacterium]|nr:AAA family ATPase [Candidatus Tectomicrobia bacterium]